MRYKLYNKNKRIFSRRTIVELSDKTVIIHSRDGIETIPYPDLKVIQPRLTHVVPFQRFLNTYIVIASPSGKIYRLSGDDYYFEKIAYPLFLLLIGSILFALGAGLAAAGLISVIGMNPASVRFILGHRNERILNNFVDTIRSKKVSIKSGVIDPYEFKSYQKMQNFGRHFGLQVIAVIFGFIILLFATGIVAVSYGLIADNPSEANRLVFTLVISGGGFLITVPSLYVFLRFWGGVDHRANKDVFSEIPKNAKIVSKQIFHEELKDKHLTKERVLKNSLLLSFIVTFIFAVPLGFLLYNTDTFDDNSRTETVAPKSDVTAIIGGITKGIAVKFSTAVANKDNETVAAMLCVENKNLNVDSLVTELNAIKFDKNSYTNSLGEYIVYDNILTTSQPGPGIYYTTLNLRYVSGQESDTAKYQIQYSDNTLCVYGLEIYDTEYGTQDTVKSYLQPLKSYSEY